MDVFEMVTIIVAMALGAGVVRAWLRRPAAAVADPRTDERIARLEERVRALETVVSDHGFDLKQQFRELEKSGR